MKKIVAVLAASAALSGVICSMPQAMESSVPAAQLTQGRNVMYSRAVMGSGHLEYLGQTDITSTMPLVMESFCVSEGDTVCVGDVIARVDKTATQSLIESLGQVPQIAVAAANLSTAVSLIPQEITADRSGRIIATAGSGKAVEAGGSIASVAGSDTMVLSAAVSELNIAEISLGQKAVFTLAAYPDEKFTGTVAQIAMAARNQYSGSVLETVVDILVAPDKYDERLKSGMTAQVELPVSEPREICVLDYAAIGQDDGGEFVYVYENGVACRRRIFTDAEFADGTEVVSGITAEDSVFLNPESIDGSRYVRKED